LNLSNCHCRSGYRCGRCFHQVCSRPPSIPKIRVIQAGTKIHLIQYSIDWRVSRHHYYVRCPALILQRHSAAHYRLNPFGGRTASCEMHWNNQRGRTLSRVPDPKGVRAGWIDHAKRVVSHIAVKVPTLGIFDMLIREGCIRARPSPQPTSVIPRPKVIQPDSASRSLPVNCWTLVALPTEAPKVKLVKTVRQGIVAVDRVFGGTNDGMTQS